MAELFPHTAVGHNSQLKIVQLSARCSAHETQFLAVATDPKFSLLSSFKEYTVGSLDTLTSKVVVQPQTDLPGILRT